jgi:hypothetical protein
VNPSVDLGGRRIIKKRGILFNSPGKNKVVFPAEKIWENYVPLALQIFRHIWYSF